MAATIVVKGVQHERGGNVSLMVFGVDGFPKDHAKAITKIDVEPSTEDIRFDVLLPEGEFALKAHHDENSDGKVSKNWTKILPAEGLAFSNGARVRFGPPSFKSAKMISDNNVEIELVMIYP